MKTSRLDHFGTRRSCAVTPGEIIIALRHLGIKAAHRASMMSAFIPTAPRALVSADVHRPFQDHITSIERELSTTKLERDAAFSKAREAQNAALLALNCRHAGDQLGASAKLSEATNALLTVATFRDADDDQGFQHAAQQVCTVQIFHTFLSTGTLGVRPFISPDWSPEAPQPSREVGAKAPRPSESSCTPARYSDEEWLGALVSSAHEIGRYASGAATCGDTRSVHAARSVVGSLHDAMAAFDLRNGNLRKSFDSLKYVVRRLEDTTYELSLFPPRGTDDADDAAALTASADPPLLLDVDALEAARETYAALDAAREAIIKKCREPQKLAKQAISALHRNDLRSASQSLRGARTGALALLCEDLSAHPTLRSQGSVRAMLEELAEAALFEAWLVGDSATAAAAGGNGAGAANGVLLLRGDEALLGAHLQTSEYLGALCDLVGEIGRYAVRKATERDAQAVRGALASAVAVQSALLSLGSSAPRGLHKKGDTLRTAVRKMETLLYELSLVERSGRVREAPPELPDQPQGGGGAGEDD